MIHYGGEIERKGGRKGGREGRREGRRERWREGGGVNRKRERKTLLRQKTPSIVSKET
jgi:hypothetical protein